MNCIKYTLFKVCTHYLLVSNLSFGVVRSDIAAAIGTWACFVTDKTVVPKLLLRIFWILEVFFKSKDRKQRVEIAYVTFV